MPAAMTRAAACISSHCASHLRWNERASALAVRHSRMAYSSQHCYHRPCCCRAQPGQQAPQAGHPAACAPPGSTRRQCLRLATAPHQTARTRPSLPQDLRLVKQAALAGAEVAVAINLLAAPPAGQPSTGDSGKPAAANGSRQQAHKHTLHGQLRHSARARCERPPSHAGSSCAPAPVGPAAAAGHLVAALRLLSGHAAARALLRHLLRLAAVLGR